MRILSPILAGRDGELAAVRSWLALPDERSAPALLISGEAGIGKSRLLREAQAAAAHAGWRVWQGHCFEHDRDTPFAPLLDLLARVAPDHLRRTGFDAVAPQLLKLAPDLAPAFPEVQLAPVAEPEQERRDLLRAWMAWLSPPRLAPAGPPTLVIIEDLHWCDELALELLLRLARAAADRPLALLLSYRSDEGGPALERLLAQLDRERLAHEITLRPLPADAIAAMIGAIFGQAQPVSAEFVGAVAELTEGNPFFVEEVLGSLVSAGDIYQVEGRWDRKRLHELQIPRSIRDAVQRRIGRLDPLARHVLLLAAVAGRRLSYAALQALAGLGEAELQHIVGQLIDSQLLAEEPGDVLAFRHALTREAIYGALHAPAQRALHRQVAVTLESLYGPAPGRRAGELAQHWFAAGSWEQAVAYSIAAGDRAREIYAPREALSHYTLALTAIQQLGRQAPVELLRAAAQMYDTLGAWEPARDAYERALRAARDLRDTRAEWQCLVDLGFLWTGRDYRRAREHLQRALDVARALDDPRILAQSLNRFGNWEANAQQPEHSRQFHLEALALYRAGGDRAGEAQTHDLLGTESYILGDAPFAAAHYAQAITLFRELDDRGGLASALAMVSLQGGSYALDTTTVVPTTLRDCREAGDEAIQLAQMIGARPLEAYAHMIAALGLGPRGVWGDALAHAHAALRIADEIGHETNAASARWALGAISLDMLDLAEAQRQLERGLALIAGRGAAFLLGHLSACLARVQIAQADLAAAEEVLDQMQSSSTPMQTVWQRALWAARAELALAQGRPEAALQLVARLLHTAGAGPVPRLLYLQGAALSALRRYAEAEAALGGAGAACERYGAASLHWRVRRALGAALQLQRRTAAAREQYDAARALADRMAEGLPSDQGQAFVARARAQIPRLPQPSGQQIARDAHGGLTAREREVAALIAEGHTNREIAAQLVLSERTVEKHVEHVMQKLDFSSRAQVAVWMASQNLRSGST